MVSIRARSSRLPPVPEFQEPENKRLRRAKSSHSLPEPHAEQSSTGRTTRRLDSFFTRRSPEVGGLAPPVPVSWDADAQGSLACPDTQLDTPLQGGAIDLDGSDDPMKE